MEWGGVGVLTMGGGLSSRHSARKGITVARPGNEGVSHKERKSEREKDSSSLGLA